MANTTARPDNRCCFCWTLRTGTIIIALINAIVNIIAFCCYCTSPSIQSGWGYSDALLSNLDLTYLAIFILQLIVDMILLEGAIRRLPSHVSPWLWTNATIAGLLIVLLSMLLFFGSVQSSLNHNEYITALITFGLLGAIHIFSFFVVYQLRRNLIAAENCDRTMMSNDEAANAIVILNDGGGSDLVIPTSLSCEYDIHSTPPPGYDDVTNSIVGYKPVTLTDIQSNSATLKLASCPPKISSEYFNTQRHIEMESPPNYDTAMASASQKHEKTPNESEKTKPKKNDEESVNNS